MESFLNKVEREANLEAERIRKEVEQIIDVLNALQLDIPKGLQGIVSPVEALPTDKPVRQVTEKKVDRSGTKAGHQQRVEKMRAKAEADYQLIRGEIREALNKGPKLRTEIEEQTGRGVSTIRRVGNRMKKDGEVDYRTRGFQGPTEWFLVERPVSLETLRDNVVDRKGGDIPLVQTQVKLGFQSLNHLTQMLDELVSQNIIWKRDHDNGTYSNYVLVSERDALTRTRTLHEKKKYSGGNGVAGTGRSEITSNSEVKAYLNKVKAQGGKVKLRSGGHIQIEKDGKSITVGKSPSKSGILQDKNRVKSVLGLNV